MDKLHSIGSKDSWAVPLISPRVFTNRCRGGAHSSSPCVTSVVVHHFVGFLERKMPKPGLKKHAPPEEALNPLQEAARSLPGPNEEDDLTQPENTTDSSHSDHSLSTSKSNEDQECVPPFAKDPGPSTAPQTTRGKAAPPLTAQRKRSFSLGSSVMVAEEDDDNDEIDDYKDYESDDCEDDDNDEIDDYKDYESDDESDDYEDDESDDYEDDDNDEIDDYEDHDYEEEEEMEVDMDDGGWHGREEDSIKPAPLRFLPVRTPRPTCDSSTACSPISLFRLFFSDSVVQKIIDNTNANAAKRERVGMRFQWEALTTKDFYTFLSIVIFTDIVRLIDRADYWSKEWPYNFRSPADHMARRPHGTVGDDKDRHPQDPIQTKTVTHKTLRSSWPKRRWTAQCLRSPQVYMVSWFNLDPGPVRHHLLLSL